MLNDFVLVLVVDAKAKLVLYPIPAKIMNCLNVSLISIVSKMKSIVLIPEANPSQTFGQNHFKTS